MNMEQRILDGLVARGMPVHIAQGAVANMIAESRLDPGINEAVPVVPGSRGGFGLNQWTGPRRRAFEAEAQRRGVPLDDVDFQLDYTMMEFEGPERRAFERLMQAPDAMQAARIYSDSFLRPGIPHMDRRLAEAARLAGMEYTPQASAQRPQQAPQNALAAQQPQAPQNAFAAMQQPQTPPEEANQLRMQQHMLDPRAFQGRRQFGNALAAEFRPHYLTRA